MGAAKPTVDDVRLVGHAAPVTANDDLAKALGAPPPASVAALPAETLARLADQVVAAKKRQDADLEKSVKVAIDGVPFAVRGIVRKALLG